MTCQTREVDNESLFSHENNTYPPTISSNGYLNVPGSKSDILKKLDHGLISASELPTSVDTHVFDGPGIMYSLKSKVSCCNTFGEFRTNVFLPWLLNQLEHCNRVDFVWDRYPTDSLKSYTREERGNVGRRYVGYNIKLPAKMDSFLKNSTNKEDLFTFLSQGVHSLDIPAQKHFYITIEDSVIAKGVSVEDIGSCDHEESDTRVMVHIVHAIMNGSRSVFLSTVDSDVVIISTYVFSVLYEHSPIFKCGYYLDKERTRQSTR